MKFLQTYSIRGNLLPAEGAKYIQLFDGKFDTGYRVTKFVVGPQAMDNNTTNVYSAKLMTVGTGSATEWNWSDNREIAWCMQQYDGNGTSPLDNSIIDRDNMIIEDVYIYPFNTNINLRLNYYIEFEKYDISESRGAMAQVRNK